MWLVESGDKFNNQAQKCKFLFIRLLVGWVNPIKNADIMRGTKQVLNPENYYMQGYNLVYVI